MRYSALVDDRWRDEAFQSLDIYGRDMYYYLLSPPSGGNLAGLYRLLEQDVDRELGEGACRLLYADTKLWKYDSKNAVVFIPNYLKYNPARTDKQVCGLNNSVKGLPMTPLFVDFFFDFYRYSKIEAVDRFEPWIRRLTKAEASVMLEKDPTNTKASVVCNLLLDT